MGFRGVVILFLTRTKLSSFQLAAGFIKIVRAIGGFSVTIIHPKTLYA